MDEASSELDDLMVTEFDGPGAAQRKAARSNGRAEQRAYGVGRASVTSYSGTASIDRTSATCPPLVKCGHRSFGR